MSNISMKISVAGHVQGVGFRYFTQQKRWRWGSKAMPKPQ
ncbi:acylphosphatase [Plesiomonas shigelloides]|nr:acylphosphatase [Plesiomonas shigelloides]